jgi:hypothetical protein
MGTDDRRNGWMTPRGRSWSKEAHLFVRAYQALAIQTCGRGSGRLKQVENYERA